MTMPWMELAPDISGVCRVAGTLPMTSTPMSSARTNSVMATMMSMDYSSSFFCLAAAGYDQGVVEFFVQVDAQLAVTHEVGEHVGHVAAQQVGCGGGHAAGEIRGADDGHAAFGDLRADGGAFDVAAKVACRAVDDDGAAIAGRSRRPWSAAPEACGREPWPW